jgi:hypothetical protein
MLDLHVSRMDRSTEQGDVVIIILVLIRGMLSSNLRRDIRSPEIFAFYLVPPSEFWDATNAFFQILYNPSVIQPFGDI